MEVRTRKILCELDAISRADGSAKVQHGDTIVTCGVYGPVEVKSVKEQHNKAVIDMVVRAETGLLGTSERQLEGLMTSCCESCILTHLHPHTAISITLQIENNQGSVISCLTHALCLALMDAALPLKTTFSSLTCVFTDNKEMLTDPDIKEEENSVSMLTYIVDRQGSLISSHSKGTFSTEQFLQGLAAAGSTVTNMTDFYRTAISRKMSRINGKPVKIGE